MPESGLARRVYSLSRSWMKVCLDVDYRANSAVAAAVGFAAFGDEHATLEHSQSFDAPPAPYEPGQFYRRELPYLLELLRALTATATLVLVDGYVWLDGERPGLGAHLHGALRAACPVIGVAKRPFVGATRSVPILRGSSAVPLFVSAVGMDAHEAADNVRQMHGPHRIPTLLRRVDQLSRA
jgi:deoxyribonuclease V